MSVASWETGKYYLSYVKKIYIVLLHAYPMLLLHQICWKQRWKNYLPYLSTKSGGKKIC